MLKKVKGDNRGISKITLFILVLLIILILVAYFVVKNIVLKGSGERSIGKFTLDLKITQVQIIQNNSLNVVVKRNKGLGEFTGINFIVDDGKTKESIQTNVSMEELESRDFILHLRYVNASEVKKVSIDAIFNSESEKEFGQNIKDVYIVDSSESNSIVCKPSCPSGAQCGSDGCGRECGGGCIQEGYICLDSKCIATLETKCLGTSILVTQVSNITTNFTINLFRSRGEDEIGGIKLAFANENSSSNFVVDEIGNIASLENVTKYATIPEDYLVNPEKVRIIVYFMDENGAPQFCDPSGQITF